MMHNQGAIIYEMLSGRPPFYNKNRQIMLKDIVEVTQLK